MKVVLLDRVDRDHERGPELVWPGHHGLNLAAGKVKQTLDEFRALARYETGGACDLQFDVAEETQALRISGGDLAERVRRYLDPRINGGRYDAEDNVYRGPYASVMVIHPVGGESRTSFDVQGATVDLIGLADLDEPAADGTLALAMNERWIREVATRAMPGAARDAGPIFRGITPDAWGAVVAGPNATTEERLRLLALKPFESDLRLPLQIEGPRGLETLVHLVKDPVRGNVLAIEEYGTFRGGGLVLPAPAGGGSIFPDVEKAPTLAFWAKSDAKDPIVVGFRSEKGDRTVVLGEDVPFAYDNAWHRVKIDLRPLKTEMRIQSVAIGVDANTRTRFRQTLGPISAYFSDFETSAEAPDARPTPEAPSANALDPVARARWAAASGPGEERRALLKDPVEAVRANAVAAALVRPDPADEPALIEDGLFSFEPNVFEPALRALGNLKTPTADEALRRALRAAAADRARGFAAEVLAASGDAKLVPLFVGLNQARTRAARVSAIRALAHIPGEESALMRMAYLPQNDPETKLEATLTTDANDDAQARKLLWSAINEPSDAVRLESLRRLAASKKAEFQTEGLNGVRDDSIGVRVGLLEAWTAVPDAATLPAIRVAVGDLSPRVRAAALAALAANAGPVDAKDVPFDDPDARVQLAALRLAKAKGISIPEDVRERLRKSPDSQVRKEIG